MYDRNQRPSMVYIMTNMDTMNQVIAFNRNMNGMLSFMGAYSTNGKGTGIKEVSGATGSSYVTRRIDFIKRWSILIYS